MKKKLLNKNKTVLACLAFLFSVLGFFVYAPSTQAAGEDYVYYYSKSTFTMTSREYNESAIYARKGVFGNNAIKLTPGNSGTNAGNQAAQVDLTNILNARLNLYHPFIGDDHGFYVGSYNCQEFKISIMLGITARPPQNTFGGSQRTVGSELWILGASKGGFSANGATMKANFPDCMPSKANSYSNVTNPKKIQLPLYFALGDNAGNNWFNFLTSNGHNVARPGAGITGAPPVTDGASPENDDETDNVADCDTKLLNPLSWIICPIIDIGANGSDFIFQKIVEPLLSDIPLSTNPEDGFFKAWQGFRLIANILLVIGMLGIVYSMARGDK